MSQTRTCIFCCGPSVTHGWSFKHACDFPQKLLKSRFGTLCYLVLYRMSPTCSQKPCKKKCIISYLFDCNSGFFFLVRKKKDLKKYIFSKSGWRYIILITLYINYIYFTVRNKDIYYIYFFINKIRPILLNVILNSI